LSDTLKQTTKPTLMKKQILFAIILLFTSAIIKAQGPYTNAEFGVVGDSLFYTSVNVDTSTLNFALAGANANWNFSSLAPTTQFNYDFLNPLNAGYRAAFLTECTGGGSTLTQCNTQFTNLTNVAFRDLQNINIQGTLFTNVVNNDLKTANALEENILGVTTKISGVNVPFTCKYNTPDVIYVFPINYGNRDTSISSYTIDLTPRGVNFIYHAHNARVNYADAYGTLVSPHATYTSTVRVRSFVLHTDTLIYNNAIIPIAPYTSFEYSWFNASFTAPVFTASGIFAGAQQKFQKVTYLDTIHCLAPRAAEHHVPAPGVIDPSVGNVVVNFTNTSTNANTYTWNFGDPASGGLNTSTTTNPSHTYDSAGTYQIELIACNTACNPQQCDTGLFTLNVVDSGQLRASFTVTPATACIQDTVKFRNTSNNSTSWLWNFGDQNTSTLKNPKHIYTLPGTYTVTLIAINGTQTDTTTRTITVNSPPSAQITATGPTTFCNGDSVTLAASGGNVYHWSNGHVGPTIKVKATGTFTVTVTNSCGSSTSAPVTVTVNTPVDTVIALGSTTVCTGDSVKLTVNTTNGATYQWKRNGQVIAGATQSTYYAKITGNYVANVFANSCEGVSNVVRVTANTPPNAAIFTQGSTSLCTGDSVKLIASTANGDTYQWQNNGNNIVGATVSNYYAKTSGGYTAVVTRNGCSATSNSIIITSTVTPQPTITAHGGTTTCQGDSIYLTTAAGNGYIYQWLFNGNNISGANSPFVYASNTGGYSVVATFNSCSGTSPVTTITVNPSPTANAGSSQSIAGCSFSNSVGIGGNPTANGGTSPYTYIWSPSSGLNDSVIANPTVNGIGSTTNYTVVVTDNKGCTASASVLITVTGSSLTVVIDTTGNTSWCFGTNNSVGLSAAVTGGTGPYLYNWSPSTNLSSTTNASTTASPTVAGVYDYAVVVTDHNGCQAGANKPVTVVAQPVVTILSLDTTAPCAGDTIHFVASPGSGYTYQWLNGGNAINGATNINYQAVPVSAGSYSVSVTAGICSATSNAIAVTVRPLPTAVVVNHGGTSICTGTNTLLLASTGTGYSYQWYQNGYGITGAIAATYVVQDSGSYYAAINLNGCTLNSDTTLITIVPYPVDTITAAGPTTFCSGDSVVLNVSTGAGYLYQWLGNGDYIPNANDSTITVSSTGTYAALVSLASCASTSTGIVVTVIAYPTAILTNTGNLTFCGGDSVTLNATDSSNYNYIWFNNVGGTLDTLPNVTPSITVGDSGSYFAVISQGSCITTSNSIYANELALPNAVAIANGSGYICSGDSVIISAGTGVGYSYEWFFDNNPLIGDNSSTYVATDSGTYTVVVTSNGCRAVSNFVYVSYDSCTLGIQSVVETESIDVFPNPAHNAAIISLKCSQAGNISIALYDIVGKQVATVYQGNTFAGSNVFSIPISHLALGMYVLKIYDGASIITRKLVKE